MEYDMETTDLRHGLTQEEDRHCVWDQAGVVSRKLCKIRYDCPSCRFDRIMRDIADENKRLKQEGKTPKGKRGKIVSWKEAMRTRPASQRPCIHHMRGHIAFRVCTHDYRCSNCDFEQYFHDQYVVHAVVRPVDVLDVKGFRIPQGFYLHPGHTWIRVEEGSRVRVGIDEFALRLFGPFDRIEAPLMGKEVRQGKGDINVVREEHKADFISPVSGVVTAVNAKLREEGDSANQDPYSEGWVMTVHSKALRQDLKNLMIHKESAEFMEKEVAHLYQVIEESTGPLAADGGYLGHNIYGQMPELGWERLVKTFLKT
jgi:glycine cleavage system H lipoate-binding protein